MIWTQTDPLYRFAPDAAGAAPRRSFLYTMVLNNPLRFLDPDGRQPMGPSLDEVMRDEWDEAKKARQNEEQQHKAEWDALILVSCIMSGKGCGNLRTGYAKKSQIDENKYRQVDWDDELTPAQANELGNWLRTALTRSSALREVVGALIEGAKQTVLLLTGSGETGGRAGTDNNFFIFFNPRDVGAIWQGGFFNPGGRSRQQQEQPDAVLAHELFHGYMSATRQDESMSRRQKEKAAWDFENIYRRQAGLPSRDCYFKCAGNYSQDAGPDD
jgi:hypothetical protein